MVISVTWVWAEFILSPKSINGILTSFTLSSFVDILEHWLQLTPGLRQQFHLIIQSRMNVNEDSGVKKNERKV